MLERISVLVAYVGSAALVAFTAVCVESTQSADFVCRTNGANGAQRCELASEGAVQSTAAGKAVGAGNANSLSPP